MVRGYMTGRKNEQYPDLKGKQIYFGNTEPPMQAL